MPSFTSFSAADVGRQEVTRILSDYVALDRARFWRRLLVVRFGLLAMSAALIAHVVPGLSAYGRWMPALLSLTPPAWAWIAEVRLARRLARRLHACGSVGTYTVGMEASTFADPG